MVDQLPGFRQCRARFPPTILSLQEVAHAVLSSPSIDDADVASDCARLVEQKLFGKIYSGEIHLGDGDAKFADPAAHSDRQRPYFANVRPTHRRLLEMDEAPTLHEIGRRLVGSDIPILPSSAHGISLGVASKPMIQDYGLDQDTGYASEDEIGLDAMVLANAVKGPTNRVHYSGFGTLHSHQSRESFTTVNHIAREMNGGHPSNQPVPVSRNGCRSDAYANRCQAEMTIESHGQANLLPPGDHRYVSPPPFPNIPGRRLHVESGRAQARSASDQDDDEEVTFLGERTVARDLRFDRDVRGRMEI